MSRRRVGGRSLVEQSHPEEGDDTNPVEEIRSVRPWAIDLVAAEKLWLLSTRTLRT